MEWEEATEKETGLEGKEGVNEIKADRFLEKKSSVKMKSNYRDASTFGDVWGQSDVDVALEDEAAADLDRRGVVSSAKVDHWSIRDTQRPYKSNLIL